MERQIWNEEIECMPAEQLMELSLHNFRAMRVMERAARSALYREKWAAAGVDPKKVQTYADLAQVPYTAGRELREAQARYHPDELICADAARIWVSTSGTTGTPKWIPGGDGDLPLFTEALNRQMSLLLGVTTGWSFLVLLAPAPFLSESSLYHLLVNQLFEEEYGELTFVALPESFDALDFARKAEHQGIFGFPSMALLIAEGVTQRAAEGAANLFKKERSLRNLVGMLATKVVKVRARDVFKFKWAMFGGEPVGPYRSALIDAFGLEPFSVYGATEFRNCPPVAECKAHNGLHLFADLCVPEIIPRAELDREGAEAGYVPKALHLCQATPGAIGELVITTFADALPIVRYRMSDLVEIVSTDKCSCGRTHPRISINHRSDDIVNLGLIRFSVYLLKEKLSGVHQHGKVAKWQLRVTRENHKPKALLLVEPVDLAAQDDFVEEVKAKVDEMEGVKLARQNGLIANPEVRLVESLVEERTGTGKILLAVYEDDYFREA